MNQITGNRPDIPVVTIDRAHDTVAVQLNGHDAVVLAKILAHYDALVGHLDAVPAADGYDPPVWHHTLLELLTANARLGPALSVVGFQTALNDGAVQMDTVRHLLHVGGAR